MDTYWDAFYGGLREVFWFAVRHLMGYGGSLCADVIEALLGYLPEDLGAGLASYTFYIDIANAWIPIDLGVVLFGVWVTAKFAILTTRHIIKMIPGIG